MTTYTVCDFDTFKPEEYFLEYHFYEVFDKDKNYVEGTFNADYGKGEHTYEYMNYVIGNYKDNTEQKFIVAQEVLSTEENAQLKEYCECAFHKGNFIKKLITCKCCVGCLESPFPQQYAINGSRERFEKGGPSNDNSSCTLF